MTYWPLTFSLLPSSIFLAFFFISCLSCSWFTVSNIVSAISCCHRSEIVTGKFLYSSWSASESCVHKEWVLKNYEWCFCCFSQLSHRRTVGQGEPKTGQKQKYWFTKKLYFYGLNRKITILDIMCLNLFEVKIIISTLKITSKSNLW